MLNSVWIVCMNPAEAGLDYVEGDFGRPFVDKIVSHALEH